VAQNNAWEIEVRQLDGTLRRLIRLPVQPRPLTPDQAAKHRKELIEQIEAVPMLKNLPQIAAQMRKRIEDAVYPETFPFIEGMLAGPDGALWVQEVQDVGVESGPLTVFDSAGSLLGRVRMPAGFRATAIGSDRVYGVWKDEEEIPRVRVYRLQKGT
jgi:hypothetical protein